MEVEKGTYLKKWKDKYPIALVYPNTYAVGMSSLGFQLVYALLNERSESVCERFFLPEVDEPLLSLESGRPLPDFPLIFFSVSFEHDYLNLVKILLLGGIEPFAKSRKTNHESSPIVGFGGVATFMNPEPIAPFADFMVIGEAEPIVDTFLDFIMQHQQDLARDEMLFQAARDFEGIYVPGLYSSEYDANRRCKATHAADSELPARIHRISHSACEKAGHSELLSPATEFSNLYLTELGRGCSRGCRFCAAGFIYRPPRLWDADAVIQGLNEKGSDVHRIGLLGMEMAKNNALDEISAYLVDSGCALSFSSLRADRINDKLLNLLSQSQLKSVAIAPDGTSERLRSVINKGLNQEDLIKGATRLVDAGIYKLKLYVMVGLPTETCEDLQEFIDLIHIIKEQIDPVGKERGRLTEILVSVNCFVPKPWTPFQYHPFGISKSLDEGENFSSQKALTQLKEKITFLKKGVKQFANVHFQADKPENAMFQALLSRGDRRIADVLYDMARYNTPWKKSMINHNLSPEMFILCGSTANTYFPWYIIDHGMNHSYLWEEYQKGLKAVPTEPCDPSICRRCGVCGEI